MVLELGDSSIVRNETTGLSCDVEFKTKVRLCVFSRLAAAGVSPCTPVRRMAPPLTTERVTTRPAGLLLGLVQRDRGQDQGPQGRRGRDFGPLERAHGGVAQGRASPPPPPLRLASFARAATQAHATPPRHAGQGQRGPLRRDQSRRRAEVSLARSAATAQRVSPPVDQSDGGHQGQGPRCRDRRQDRDRGRAARTGAREGREGRTVAAQVLQAVGQGGRMEACLQVRRPLATLRHRHHHRERAPG